MKVIIVGPWKGKTFWPVKLDRSHIEGVQSLLRTCVWSSQLDYIRHEVRKGEESVCTLTIIPLWACRVSAFFCPMALFVHPLIKGGSVLS